MATEFTILTQSSFSVRSAAWSSSLCFPMASSEKTNSRTMNLGHVSPGDRKESRVTHLLSRHFCTKSSCTRLKTTTENKLYSSSDEMSLGKRIEHVAAGRR